MKTRAAALPNTVRFLLNGAWLVPLFLVLLVFSQGCASMREIFDEKPEAEISVVTPIAYGVVTQVGTAAMAGREITKGDLALTVDLDDGRVVVVIQPEDNVYVVGDRVRVVRDGKGFVRVQLVL